MKFKYDKNTVVPLFMMLVAIVVVATALIVTNKELRMGYDFDYYQRWNYGTLVSDRTFDACYTGDTVAEITRSIREDFIPKAMREPDVESEVLAAHPGLSHAVKSTLRQMYTSGIADSNLTAAIHADSISRVSIQDATGVYIPTDTASLLTPEKAETMLAFAHSLPVDEAARLIVPNVHLDTLNNERLLQTATENALYIKQVTKGDIIIENGVIITPTIYHVLKSYYNDMERDVHDSHIAGAGRQVMIGKVAIVALLMLTLYLYLYSMRPKYLTETKRFLFMLLLLSVAAALALYAITHAHNYRYVIPLAVVPIVVTIFFDSRTSFACHLTLVLITALVVGDRVEYILMQLVAGFVAIASMQELTRRSQMVRCAANVFVAYTLMYIAVVMMRGGDMTQVFTSAASSTPSLDAFEWTVIKYFAVNCVTLSFSSILIFVIERVFGFTSTATLVELTDINTPLMRTLSEKCQGTFQHSIQVSMIASEVALRIGANVQLVRAGAMYHDIGKINNPAFFTENQMGVNPHDALMPEQSARIVIAHVTDGVQMAQKANLPRVIIDMILQHHGRGLAKYFYATACQAAKSETDVDRSIYTYPGPNPQTREAAILMMTDACEAAVKSITEPNDKNIRDMVTRVIDGQKADGLLNEAPITLSEIETVKTVITERLRSSASARVSYAPVAAQAAAQATNQPTPNQASQ